MAERHTFPTRVLHFTCTGVAENGSFVHRNMQEYSDGIRIYEFSNEPTRVYRAIPGTEREEVECDEHTVCVRDYEEIDPKSADAPAWLRECFEQNGPEQSAALARKRRWF